MRASQTACGFMRNTSTFQGKLSALTNTPGAMQTRRGPLNAAGQGEGAVLQAAGLAPELHGKHTNPLQNPFQSMRNVPVDASVHSLAHFQLIGKAGSSSSGKKRKKKKKKFEAKIFFFFFKKKIEKKKNKTKKSFSPASVMATQRPLPDGW